MKTLWAGMSAVAALALASSNPAQAQVTDCPMATPPYSLDSPLIDILLKPEAKAVMAQEMGADFAKLSPFLSGTQAPTFSVIMSPRTLFDHLKLDPSALPRIEAQLKQIPVTPADQITRCARYDDDHADPRPEGKGLHVLVFEKITGFYDKGSVDAAHAALADMAATHGWSMQFTDKGGAIRPEVLQRYNLVVWNNISGDALTLPQRAAFQAWINKGGGFVGIHGAAGDPATFWNWYTDTLIGTSFLGHPMNPQFRAATVRVADPADPVTRGLPISFSITDELYSFRKNPRQAGVHVLATLDEASYAPPSELQMGADHPIAWKHCVGRGRAYYSALGHTPASYADPNHRRLLVQAITWAGAPDAACR